MLTLAIDSTTQACSVALFDGDSLIAGDFRMLGRGHAEQLVPMIAALPGRGRADRIVTALGPGSFTGVRIGLAAARALAFAWNADLAGYDTLDLVAALAVAQRQEPVAVAMTGGHGEWFTAGYAADGSRTRPSASIHPDDAARFAEPVAAGSEAGALVAARGWGTALPLWPDARSLPLLRREALTPVIRPHYGRPPDARRVGA